MDMLNPISAGVSAASGLASTIGSWLGIGQKRQVNQQKELQEHAAKTNYEYGEKSAENAFERQMKAYEQSYSDKTLQNQVNQAKDAGLSVGLLYGGGAQGGGEGSLSGGTQGTGAAGVGAGQAPQAGLEMQGLALMQQGMKNASEIGVMDSQKKLNNAKEKEAENRAMVAEEEAESIKQKNIEQWRRNQDEYYRNSIRFENKYDERLGIYIPIMGTGRMHLDGDTYEIGENGLKGTVLLNKYAKYDADYNPDVKRLEIEAWERQFAKAIESSKKFQDVLTGQSEQEKNEAEAGFKKAMKNLVTEKQKYLFQELQIALMHGQAHMIEAKARELATQYETGEMTNWRTWVNLGLDAISTVTGGAGKLRKNVTEHFHEHNEQGKSVTVNNY